MLEESYALESRTRIFPGKANAAARLLAVGGARAAVCSFVQATTDFPKEMFPFQTFVIFLPPYWLWPESVRLLPDRHSRTCPAIMPCHHASPRRRRRRLAAAAAAAALYAFKRPSGPCEKVLR